MCVENIPKVGWSLLPRKDDGEGGGPIVGAAGWGGKPVVPPTCVGYAPLRLGPLGRSTSPEGGGRRKGTLDREAKPLSRW